MSNELVLPEGVKIVQYDAETIADLSKSGDWLPRLQVNGASSEIAKTGKAPPGIFVLVYDQNKFDQLGKEINVTSIAMRPKAMRLKPAVLAYFNPASKDFQQIREESKIKDSQCMFGLEFLMWLPDQAKFCTFFCGNPTFRRATPGILDEMNKNAGTAEKPEFGPAPVTLRTNFIKGAKHTWWGFIGTQCSVPMSSVPDPDDLLEQIQKFNTPPESQVEKVAEQTESRER